MNVSPIAQELVLAGGGHSHVIFLRMLGMKPIPGLKVTLVSPELQTPYSGMLPGLIAGHYKEDEVCIDLVPLCRFAGVDLVKSRVTGIDPAGQQVLLASRPPVHYDLLSLDVGSAPCLGSVQQSQVIAVKPIGSFIGLYESVLALHELGNTGEIGVVGAGAGGVELCLAIAYRLKRLASGGSFNLHLFTDAETILSEFPRGARARFERLLREQSIRVHCGFDAVSAVDGRLDSADGRQQQLNTIFWVTRSAAQPWLAQSGLAVDERGFVQVTDTLQSVSHANIFAVGDCATMIHHPRPKAGVYAVRQAAPLFRNIRASLLGKRLCSFKPQSRSLSLISTGPKHAVAVRNGLSAEGQWVWHWKNRIDQGFMRRFSALPSMREEAAAEAEAGAAEAEGGAAEVMPCGGCGAKISADLLAEVLGDLMGQDMPHDDAAIVDVPPGQVLLQSVDHFRSFVNDPYRQARIAVCHAVSDIYACGGSPISVMAILTLPFAKHEVTRSMLQQLLRGTIDQLQAEGARLIGGHTSEGMELSIGFAVNGLASPDQVWRKTPLREGDALILCKPLGTGAILAADMQHRAKGAWVEGALQSMEQSNRMACELLRQFDVSACTDITGFGLAGHCLEMIGDTDTGTGTGTGTSTGTGMALELAAIPVLDGAETCISHLGITSSLHEANRRATGLVDSGGKSELLFDPQTSGGLLASIKPEEAQACTRELHAAGYDSATLIGFVTNRPGLTLS